MNDYIQLALSVDPKEREGHLIITRVLQVIGEYLKNTLESPKLSNTTSELILLSLSKNTRNVIIDLRNSLSHVYSLFRRTEIEEKRDVNFFRGVQNDAKKVGDVIADILYSRKMTVIRMTLSKIMNAEKVDEIAEIARALSNVEVGKVMSVNFKMLEHEKLENLIKKLSDALIDKTAREVELLGKMNQLVNSAEAKFEDIKTQYSIGFGLLKGLCTMAHDVVDNNTLHQLKFCAGKVLEYVAPKTESSNLKEIVLSVKKILKIRSNTQDDTVHRLLHEIFITAEYGLDSIHCLEDLGGKLSDSTVGTTSKDPTTTGLTEEESNRQLEMKLSELKSILKANELKGEATGKLPSYKSNKKLQAVVEMLMLDIMSILGGTKNYLENNLLFLDESVPLLTGKCLRNHLAHNNILLDVMLSDPSVAVILNAKVLTERKIMKAKKKIGRLVRDDPSRLRDKYEQGLNIITNQEKMFVALEQGDLESVKDCLRRGADINARGLNSWTALQLAAKGSSFETVKYVLDHIPNPLVKDFHGQSPLHTAAAYGNKSTVEFFLERSQFPVDDADKVGRTPLYMAVRGGFKEIVEVLIKNGANPDAHTDDGSLLEIAIQKNHVDVVRLLLENEADINGIETYGGCTLLHAAAEHGHFEIAKLLLECGARVDARNNREETPLYIAARYGHADIVTLFIASGADVNSKVLDDCTPLLFAAVNGHEQVAKILLKHGADPNIFDKTLFYTPLHFAAKFGHEGITKALLINRANPRVASVDGVTPLHFAAQGGYLSIVKALLDYGASIHTGHNGNATALNFAADSGHLEVVKFLIERGAKVNVNPRDGFGALHSAARMGHLEVAKLLITSRATVDARDATDSTPLHEAALRGNTNIMELLIKNGADVNARTRLGVAPLPIAARNGRDAAVALLVTNGANVNAKSSLDVTALHAAVLEGHKSIAKFLIQNGADVNVRNSPGSTPLGVAVETGHKEIVELLIRSGANVNSRDREDMTPLLLAVKYNNKEILEILVASGADIPEYDDPLKLAIQAGHREIVKILVDSTRINVNMKGRQGVTVLHQAARKGNAAIVRTLLAAGAEVDAATADNHTALHCAAERGNEEVAEVLIANGADANVKSKANGFTPLHYAATYGHSGVIKVLLDHTADAGIKTSDGVTPLEMAVLQGHLEAVKVLLQREEISRLPRDDSRLTILHTAADRGNLEIVKYLVGQGCDINATNNAGLKPIHAAVAAGHKDTVEFFLSKGVSIDEPGLLNGRLLHYAVFNRHFELTRYLIARGADINAPDGLNMTALHVAATLELKNIVEELLKSGAMYNAVDKTGGTPLTAADDEGIHNLLLSTERLFDSVKKNGVQEVKKSIKDGACVNAKNLNSATPLHCAAAKGYDEIVSILLQNKANPNSTDSKGCTPLHHAAKFAHPKVAVALLSSGAAYDALSHSGKTPADLTEDNHVSAVLKTVDDAFQNVKNGSAKVISDLNKMSSLDTVRAVMRARNRDNKSLIVVAMQSNFNKLEELKEIRQDGISVEIDSAVNLAGQGDYQKSLRMLHIALEKREKIVGPDSPSIFDIQVDIAKVLYKQGSYVEALRLLREVLSKQMEILGLDHRDTLQTRSTMALVYYRQGQVDEASSILEEVYPKQREILGPNDPATLETRSHMAAVLESKERYDEALNAIREVHQGRKSVLGENHPKTLTSECNLANMLSRQGKHEEALKMYEIIYEKQKLILGAENLHTLKVLQSMAVALRELHRYSESLNIHQKVLDVQRRVLGECHPDVMISQCNLGDLHLAQGKWVTALKTYRQGLDEKLATFGPFYPHVQTILQKIEAVNARLKFDGSDSSQVLRFLQKNINSAASKGNVRKVIRLLSQGVDVNGIDADGRTPLHYAASNGHTSTVNILIENGADVTRLTNKGNTPLHTAISKGDNEIVNILLQHVPQQKLRTFVDAKTTSGCATALHVAAKGGFLEGVKSLLKHGATYNAENKDGEVPAELSRDPQVINLLKLTDELFSDAKVGDVGVTDKLKSLKPDEFSAVTRARDRHGSTLLQVALMNQQKGIATDLLKMLKAFN